MNEFHASEAYLSLLKKVLQNGRPARPASLSATMAGNETVEILANQSVIDMNAPVVMIPARKISYKFMAAEAAWIISGDNRLEWISRYNRGMEKFSDDGIFLTGAYGPKVSDQLSYAISAIAKDSDTRQAVISIWRENPRPSKDVPCTLSLQWLVRDSQLNCVVSMRSSDVWLGIPYDWFSFSMVSVYLLLALRKVKPELKLSLGKLYLTAGSQHVYARNFEAVKELIGTAQAQPPQPLDLAKLESPDHLVKHLRFAADEGTAEGLFNF